MIVEEPDRWIVYPRHVLVESAEATFAVGLELRFDTNLYLSVEGSPSLMRSPRRDADAQAIESIRDAPGSRQASLVLFNSGSVRLVLSNGMVLQASTEAGGTIRCHRPGDFEWVSRDGTVTRERGGD